MEDYMDHKQECLWVCNTHWVMNSNEKVIMKFQCTNTCWIQTPCIKAQGSIPGGYKGSGRSLASPVHTILVDNSQ